MADEEKKQDSTPEESKEAPAAKAPDGDAGGQKADKAADAEAPAADAAAKEKQAGDEDPGAEGDAGGTPAEGTEDDAKAAARVAKARSLKRVPFRQSSIGSTSMKMCHTGCRLHSGSCGKESPSP